MIKTNIYVLLLEGGRYYVGKSSNITSRYNQHMKGSGSAWTRKFKPISLVKTVENVSPFEEDKITKEYMFKYGINNVRGGTYVEMELDYVQKEMLNREIRAATNLCKRCGQRGHYEKDCYSTKQINLPLFPLLR